ncbi:TPA: hypothetical protein R3O59_003218 [Yersinia enterocolitica]|nr:hypothetical protein [Yersinia enterocolitica]
MDKHIEVKSTPAANWRQEGKTDPHNTRYECQRVDLTMGQLTDDEIANAVFLCDHRTSFDSIVYLTAAKDRIRWLSRSNEALIAQLEAAQKERDDLLNQEFQQRLANAEHQLYMKDLAIHNIKASRKAQFRKRLAAEAELSAAQKVIKNLESKVNHYVAAEYARKHFDQTPDIIKRADSAELELVKVKSELSAANEKLSKPVVLPSLYDPQISGDAVTRAKCFANNRAVKKCAVAVKAAGFKVEGE